MFAIPWHGHAVVGTTDTPIQQTSAEPQPLAGEIEFILETAGNYLSRRPSRKDILSAFTGIRPLVNAGHASSTAALSREHTITISNSGLLTIAGGKWTTYRKMAEDGVDHAAFSQGWRIGRALRVTCRSMAATPRSAETTTWRFMGQMRAHWNN